MKYLGTVPPCLPINLKRARVRSYPLTSEPYLQSKPSSRRLLVEHTLVIVCKPQLLQTARFASALRPPPQKINEPLQIPRWANLPQKLQPRPTPSLLYNPMLHHHKVYLPVPLNAYLNLDSLICLLSVYATDVWMLTRLKDAAAPRQDDTVKAETNNTEPLAPPPRPEPAAPAVSNTPDYFSVAHGTHLSYETNPFENSFATGGAGSTRGDQTPGGTKLPSVASLTSPSGLLGSGATPNFWGSLRSGPLSPAMLSGPQKDDYFSDGHHLRGGFPTPNESGLRSGLTPGGGGSMFPEPSPNSQALFNQLAGAATPGTLDFQRTALNAAAAQRKMPPTSQPSVTSQPQELPATLDVKPQVPGPFDQHDANDAANGLFLLAQAQTRNNGSQQTNHYAMASQMPVHAHPQPMMPIAGQSAETSPNVANRNNSSVSTNSARGVSEMSGQSDENDQQNRPNTRGKNKRSSTQMSQTNGRRKADETPSKAPAGKKGKGNNGQATEAEQQSEEEQDTNKDEYNSNGKKMTDEEKRKNFLERNRLVCSSSPLPDVALT